MQHLYPEQIEDADVTSAAPLPSTGSTEVASLRGGPSMEVSNLQDDVEAGKFGESTLHVESHCTVVESRVPAGVQDDQFAPYSGNGR
jgi:hypothetical protein